MSLPANSYKKGIVLDRATPSQRASKNKIMEKIFKNNNDTIVGYTRNGGINSFLEGGDFFIIAKNDLSMLDMD